MLLAANYIQLVLANLAAPQVTNTPAATANQPAGLPLIVTICIWLLVLALVGLVFCLFFGRRPPKRDGQRTKWCPGRISTSKVVRLIRSGPFRAGCWYDLTDAPVDANSNITCPECGRVLDARRSNLFRRRRPRWKLAFASVCVLLTSIGTGGYVIAQSPQWVKVTPTFVLAIMLDVDEMAKKKTFLTLLAEQQGSLFDTQASNLASQMHGMQVSRFQQSVFDELVVRAVKPLDLPTRTILHPKLENLTLTAKGLDDVIAISGRLGPRSEFLVEELIVRIDASLEQSSFLEFGLFGFSQLIQCTESPKQVEAFRRWLFEAKSSMDASSIQSSVILALSWIPSENALELLLESKNVFEGSFGWRSAVAQCAMVNSPLSQSLEERVRRAVFGEGTAPYASETLDRVLRSGLTVNEYFCRQIELAEAGRAAQYYDVGILFYLRIVSLENMDRVVGWIHSDDPLLWKCALRCLNTIAHAGLQGRHALMKIPPERFSIYKAEVEKAIDSLETGEKRRKLVNLLSEM
ncbi:MAG: hypothetical protein H6815_03900 [Phycisphaeraceae bacterium]|nr:hypothetical protein [Phycisphaerales bacterium]MCB9859573.1 hypothetical protein [Phycisphaeraceae bacterium]